jgi:hypothetical protein
MRSVFIALATVAFSVGATAALTSSADAAKEPAKTKKGCIIGKEKWDAKEAKCVAAAPVKKAAKKA